MNILYFSFNKTRHGQIHKPIHQLLHYSFWVKQTFACLGLKTNKDGVFFPGPLLQSVSCSVTGHSWYKNKTNKKTKMQWSRTYNLTLEIEKELTYSSLSRNVFELSKNNHRLHILSVSFQIDPCSIKLSDLVNQNPTKIEFWNRIQEFNSKRN